jgi:hypothetical protein
MENKYVKCFDKFGLELKEGDVVDVQKDGGSGYWDELDEMETFVRECVGNFY